MPSLHSTDKARSAVVCALLSLLLASGVPVIAGQANQPVLSGRVTDTSGAAVPGATVTVSRPQSSVPLRTVLTTGSGRFEVAGLSGGNVDVTVELSGFRPAVLRGVAVDAREVAVTLELAGFSESVMVFGERSERSLRDTAASVAVFDERTLEQRPLLLGTTDLLARIPNMTSTGTNNFAPSVRGADGTGPAQGADAFFAGTRARLNIQVDGRPASYNEVVFGDVGLWDVDQVEVFRGAQSTLQGRNAVAGTVVVKTKDPSYQPEVKVRAGAGNMASTQLSGVVSGPLLQDRVAARFAFDRSTSHSFVDGFTAFRGVQEPGRFESLMLRGKLLVEPDAAKRVSTLLTINHSSVRGPQTEGVLRPFDERVSSFPQMPVFEPESTSGGLETRWTWNERVGYEHTLAFTSLHVERKAVPGDGNAEIDGRELVFEPRVRFSSRDTRIKGFAGLYAFRGRQDETIDLFGGGAFDDETTTVAAFGEASIGLPEDVEITLGGRIEQEHRRRIGSDGPFAIDFDETYRVFSPKVGVAWRANGAVTIGAVVSRGYNGGSAGFTYDFPFVSYTFAPEYVWNYETYTRADLYRGKLTLTGNAFVSDYTNMQLPFDLNPDPRIWSFVVRNADAALTFGGEAGATWRPAGGLELFASAGLLKTEITEFSGSSVEGNALPRSPAFTTDVGLLYRHRTRFDAGIDIRYSDAYYSSVTNEPRGKVDPYALMNAQAGYSLSGARLFVFVTNIFDSAAPVLLEPGATTAEDVAMIVRPRRAGVGLTWGF
jgi:iron complex outermembrane recepter protein